jgi:cation:H+ antiporter
MSSLAPVGLLVLGLMLVVGGAELFFDGLLGWAGRLGISPFLLTALLSGLELENLVAGIVADLKGLPGAAAGTFLGGTTFIVLAVAGLSAAVYPIRVAVPRAVLLWTAASPLPLLGLALDGDLSRLDGGLLVGWFAVCLSGIAYSGRGILGGERPKRRRYTALRLIAGLGLLSGGGEALGEGIHRTVSRFEISQSLLGNTAVAAAVELEEVGRVAVPARHGRGDVSVGNLVGTIPHFIALNAGVIALVRPLDLGGASLDVYLPPAVGGTALLAAVLAWRRGIGRLEGIVLLALYAGYVVAAVLTG